MKAYLDRMYSWGSVSSPDTTEFIWTTTHFKYSSSATSQTRYHGNNRGRVSDWKQINNAAKCGNNIRGHTCEELLLDFDCLPVTNRSKGQQHYFTVWLNPKLNMTSFYRRTWLASSLRSLTCFCFATLFFRLYELNRGDILSLTGFHIFGLVQISTASVWSLYCYGEAVGLDTAMVKLPG